MSNILIKKINESYVKIYSEDESIYYELYDKFSFYVDGYKFMPKFKNGIWDGQIHLFNKITHLIYSGLVPRIKKFADENGYIVKLDYDINLESEIYSFDEYNLPFKPHDFQTTALNYILNHKNGIILSPTASGKSLIIFGAIRELMLKNKRTLVVAPRTSLVDQLFTNFRDDYGWKDAENHVHVIYSGKDKQTSKEVVISTWQSLQRLPARWFEQFDAVLVDECHEADAKSLTSIMEKCTNAEYRFGLTGTLKDAKASELTLVGLFGESFNTAKTHELIERGIVSDFNIKCVVLKYSKEESSAFAKMKYKDEMKIIIENSKRNNLIANLALDQQHNTLILFNYVERHGKVLFDLLNEKNEKGENKKKIFFLWGNTSVEDRAAARQYTENNEDVILVASSGIFSTGTNIKNINVGIFAHPYKSKIKNLQSIGRLLRKAPNGDIATLYDIADDYSGRRKKKNITYNHFIERLKLYEREQFKYKIIKLDV